MKKAALLLSSFCLPAIVLAQDTPPAPKQTLKAEIIISIGKDIIKVAAKRPEMASRANLFTGEKFWRLLFPANQPVIPSSPFSLSTSLDPNDLPGGGLFLCSMKKDDDNFYFNTSSDAGTAPKKEFVIIKPSEIETTKNQDGTFTYQIKKELKPGAYAFYVSDNQYAWPFLIK